MSLKKSDLAEAVMFLRSVLSALSKSASGATQANGAELFRQVGALTANAEQAISQAQLGAPLLACFDAAFTAGATLTTIGQIRTLIMASTLQSRAAIVVQQTCLRMALIEESRILSTTKLVSRSDVDAYMARMNAAFEPAETFAADNLDADTYRALIALHAAVAQDLAARGRPLPKIVAYTYAMPLPALTLAQRLYSDGTRAADLINENKPFHPLFMPRAGIALSA